MKIDYDVGDVVVCIDDHGQHPGGDDVVAGQLYRVKKFNAKVSGVWLREADCGIYSGYKVTRFRKLPKADSSFTDLIRRVANKPKQRVDA